MCVQTTGIVSMLWFRSNLSFKLFQTCMTAGDLGHHIPFQTSAMSRTTRSKKTPAPAVDPDVAGKTPVQEMSTKLEEPVPGTDESGRRRPQVSEGPVSKGPLPGFDEDQDDVQELSGSALRKTTSSSSSSSSSPSSPSDDARPQAQRRSPNRGRRKTKSRRESRGRPDLAALLPEFERWLLDRQSGDQKEPVRGSQPEPVRDARPRKRRRRSNEPAQLDYDDASSDLSDRALTDDESDGEPAAAGRRVGTMSSSRPGRIDPWAPRTPRRQSSASDSASSSATSTPPSSGSGRRGSSTKGLRQTAYRKAFLCACRAAATRYFTSSRPKNLGQQDPKNITKW